MTFFDRVSIPALVFEFDSVNFRTTGSEVLDRGKKKIMVFVAAALPNPFIASGQFIHVAEGQGPY
jgi:hypothetical protein